MARKRRSLGQLNSSINVTPMGDVALCLLLGFLVITPIIIESLVANLPRAGVASGQLTRDPVVVVTATGQILIDDREVAFEDLPKKIAELFPPEMALAAERKVMFSASGELEYQEVIRVLDTLRAHGVETFGIR